jgi:multidrug efflux pump subunit AcrA (membrane-fusion protein)
MSPNEIKVGDVVQFDSIPQIFVGIGSSPFDIDYTTWNTKFVNKPLKVVAIDTYKGHPAFRTETPVGHYMYRLPISGTRLVSRANPATSVDVSRKDSKKSMMKKKFTPKTNKFVSNRVLGVTSGAPAALAGIKVNDTILRVGKYDVFATTSISSIVQKLGPGRKITVKVLRDGKTKVCHVTLGRDFKTGKAVLGIENNPKKVNVNKGINKDTAWAEHTKRIQDSKQKQAADAKASAEKKALEASLAKTKAEAATLKQANEESKNALDLAKKAAEEDNHFLKQAREELEGVQALLADMKGADALLEARRLRAKLREKNLNSLEASTAKVNAYLDKQMAAREKETEIAPVTVRRFSWKKALAAATVLGTAVVGGAYAYINFFPGILG